MVWSGQARRLGERIVAAGIEALDLDDRLDPPARAASLDEHDEVDRFGDEPARHRDDRLLDQLLQAIARLHQVDAIFAIFGAFDRDKRLILKSRG